MKICHLKSQSGYALLLGMLAFMGLSGAVAVGYTQQARQDVEQARYLHNKRVLEEAKRALLQYAYNYPVISGGTGGPGRLPCADTDNDGGSNTLPVDCDAVGRFPWAEPALGLNDLRDADGQRLWYTVSSTFTTNTIVNSDTSGTLTVRAPSGNIMYDGSNPDSLSNYGIAAVIIAPGAIISRNGVAQDRSISNSDNPFDTTLDTDLGIITSSRYLDLVAGTEDNATVTQGDAVDGFVLGGNRYQSNENVNDQFILITAEEVTAIAERAVLAAYRDAIDDYQQNVWALAANYRYPWLNAHADITITGLNIYDPDPLLSRRVGRVPYLNYYQDHDSHVVITDLLVDYDITLNSLADVGEVDPGYIDAFTGAFAGMFGSRTLDITNSNLSFVKRKLDGSDDIDSDSIGTLVAQTTATGSVTSASVSAPGPVSVTRFFWDGCATCIEPADGWELCNAPATDQRDCAKNVSPPYNFEAFSGAIQTDFSPHADIRIRSVILELQFDPDFEIQFDYSAAPTPGGWLPPTTGNNATFVATHNPALPNTLISIAATAQTDAKNFIDVNVLRCEQDDIVDNDYNVFHLSNSNAETVSCLPPVLDLQASVTYNLLNITADYYPELPYWVRTNGWNDSILMAYAADYQPVLIQAPPDCVTTPPCLTVTDDYAGETNNKASLLVGAGRIPANVGDLLIIFEGENSTPLDDTFAAHPNDGDDAMLILDDT